MKTKKYKWPKNGPWHWRRRYFNEGDIVKFCVSSTQERGKGKVTRVKTNKWGRISYEVLGRYVLIENIVDVTGKSAKLCKQ
jgi:hypothetical protein